MIIQSTREATREELIQRIKDLEEENKFLRDENSIYRNETISKSVIRDKIEELENEFKEYNLRKSTVTFTQLNYCPYEDVIQERIKIYKEILGDE